MKTLKLLIKTSFFNKINDFLCFDIGFRLRQQIFTNVRNFLNL